MARKRVNRSKNRRKGGELSTTALSYRGPIVDSRSKQEDKCTTMVLPWTSTLTSNSSGIINAVIPIAPNNADLWSSFAGVYDEYRVLGVSCCFKPGCSALGTPTGLLCLVIDRDSGAALTSYAGAAGYQSFIEGPLDRRISRVYKMKSSEEAQFRNTQSPSDPGSIKSFATGVAVSTTWGNVEIYYRVQFRGTGR